MGDVIELRRRTYEARRFEVATRPTDFTLAGTLCGAIDFAVHDGRTYPLSPDEARQLAAALTSAAADVEANCLYERDALLTD